MRTSINPAQTCFKSADPFLLPLRLLCHLLLFFKQNIQSGHHQAHHDGCRDTQKAGSQALSPSRSLVDSEGCCCPVAACYQSFTGSSGSRSGPCHIRPFHNGFGPEIVCFKETLGRQGSVSALAAHKKSRAFL